VLVLASLQNCTSGAANQSFLVSFPQQQCVAGLRGSISGLLDSGPRSEFSRKDIVAPVRIAIGLKFDHSFPGVVRRGKLLGASGGKLFGASAGKGRHNGRFPCSSGQLHACWVDIPEHLNQQICANDGARSTGAQAKFHRLPIDVEPFHLTLLGVCLMLTRQMLPRLSLVHAERGTPQSAAKLPALTASQLTG
jgi:hypothetical protein